MLNELESSPVSAPPDRGRYVLIVDDDQGIRDALRMMLEDSGYTVLEAADGLAALRSLRTATHDMVVLLDHRMPVLDGEAVLTAVAQDPVLSVRHAYILLTAGPMASLPSPMCGMLDNLSATVLAKPFDMEALLSAVGAAARRIVAA